MSFAVFGRSRRLAALSGCTSTVASPGVDLIAASMCICRIPTEFVEPKYLTEYQQRRREWDAKTKRDELISKDLLETIIKCGGGQGTSEPVKQPSEAVSASAESDRHLKWLIVDYNKTGIWTFPFSYKRQSDGSSMRPCIQRIRKMALATIGESNAISLTSISPMTYRYINSAQKDTTNHRVKMFYYQGVYNDNNTHASNSSSPSSSFASYKWVKRDELRDYISIATWNAVKDAIPLG